MEFSVIQEKVYTYMGSEVPMAITNLIVEYFFLSEMKRRALKSMSDPLDTGTGTGWDPDSSAAIVIRTTEKSSRRVLKYTRLLSNQYLAFLYIHLLPNLKCLELYFTPPYVFIVLC
jgi:hypothetical protein